MKQKFKYSKSSKTKSKLCQKGEQNTGNLAREYLDPKNRDIILSTLKDCEEKTKLDNLLKAWDPVKSITDKSNPTKIERRSFSDYAKNVQTKLKDLAWVQHWPNQIIRATHHNGTFLNDPNGIGSIQPYGSEGLESANAWLKRFDKYHTFKGDRKKAIKGVFKLRSLKSSYRLRKFFPVPVIGEKKCIS